MGFIEREANGELFWTLAQTLPAVQLDRSGNGMAFWMAVNTKTEIWLSRYIADTQTWAQPKVVGSGKEGAFFPLVALQKETGKGMLTWLQELLIVTDRQLWKHATRKVQVIASRLVHIEKYTNTKYQEVTS